MCASKCHESFHPPSPLLLPAARRPPLQRCIAGNTIGINVVRRFTSHTPWYSITQGFFMQWLYFILAAVHLVAIAVTGMMWTIIDLRPHTSLKKNFRDIRAVHFGSLYITPILLGLAYAFDKLNVPAWHQLFFPAGLGLLVFFSSIGYVFPRQPGLDPFYYWTRGWAMVLAMIGLACLVFCLGWTAAVLVIYSL
jgi:hypothetical protein